MHGGSGLSEFFFSVSFGIDITFKKHASIPETMPAENVTITAEFEKIMYPPIAEMKFSVKMPLVKTHRFGGQPNLWVFKFYLFLLIDSYHKVAFGVATARMNKIKLHICHTAFIFTLGNVNLTI